MRKVLLPAALLVGMAAIPSWAQLTTLTGTIRAIDGSLANGTVVFELSASMIAPGGTVVYARRTDPITITNGVPATISLYANDTGTPSTTFYRAYWDLRTAAGTDSPRLPQTCTISYSASPVTIQSVCTDSTPPIAVSSVPISRLTGGSAKGDILAYTGSAWTAHTGETTGCYFVRDDLEADGINCVPASALTGISDPGSNGILSRTAVNTVVSRTITGTANEISVADGNGVSANPTISLPSSINLSGKILELPNATSLTSTDCDEAAEAGRIFIDTDAGSGEQLYVCEGLTGWVLHTGGGGVGSGDITSVTAGAGLSGGGAVGAVSLATASTEADFLASGALTCGAGTQGSILVHTTALQYCDNSATPTLRYAAYGDSAGLATAGDSATSFFSAGALEKARQHASTVYLDAGNTYTTGAQDFGSATSLELPNGAAPTTAAFAHLAADNNAWATSRGALQTYDGTANTYLVGVLTSDAPGVGQTPRWNSDGTITWEDPSGTAGTGGASKKSSPSVLTINDGCSAGAPCYIGGTEFTGSATATIAAGSGSGTAKVYKCGATTDTNCTVANAVIVAHPTAAGLTVNCVGCTSLQIAAPTIPTTAVALASVTIVSGVWGVVTDLRNFLTTSGGGVAGPSSSTDNALVRFDGTDGQVIQNGVITMSDTGALTFPDNIRQTFNPGADAAGINIGTYAGDPGTPSDGDIWYNSSTTKFRCRENGATSNCITAAAPSTLTQYINYKAAVCQNATASLGFSTPTSNPAVAACVTGTNTQFGVGQFADGSNLSVQDHFTLPPDWTGNIDVKFKWRTSATTGSVVWQVATVCVANAETSDPAFNTASTVTDAALGTTLQQNDAEITTLTVTGCAAGEELYHKLFRDSAHASDDLAATADLISASFVVRRTL